MRALVTGTRAPAGLHQLRLLRDAGLEVAAADSAYFPLSRGSGLAERTMHHPSPVRAPDAFADWLLTRLDTGKYDRVYPSCEEVFHLSKVMTEAGVADKLYAPPLDLLLKSHDKASFIQILDQAGLSTPKTTTLSSRADLAAVAAQSETLVFKPVFSRFGEHVVIRPRQHELRDISPSPERPWVAQEYLHGVEICIHAFGAGGFAGGVAAYMPRWRVGPDRLTGAGIYFEPVEDDEITDFVRRFFSATGWTGHVGFDAILTEARGLVAIECNPRVTSGLHFFRHGKSTFAGMIGRAAARPSNGPMHVPLAMTALALPRAIKSGEVDRWRRDMARSTSATAYGMRGAGLLRQGALMCEMSIRALFGRRSILSATTADIEWS